MSRSRSSSAAERSQSFANKSARMSMELTSEYHFDDSASAVKMSVEWMSAKLDSICDLDINVLVYDEHARFIEKLNIDNPVTLDESCALEADIDTFKASKTHMENVTWNFNKVSPQTSSMLFLITGGRRNFANVDNITISCTDAFDSSTADFNTSEFVHTVNSQMHANEFSTMEYYSKNFKPRRDSESIVAAVLYRYGRHKNGKWAWILKQLLLPLHVANDDEKDKICGQTVINIVPTLAKYRSHLYPSVISLCASLSSTSLPLLKTEFSVGDGLKINAFTKTLLRQLYIQNPRVLDDSEAAYTVALLHDMFFQIDFNENGSVDWEEFTSFCIHTGLITSEASSDDQDEDYGKLNPLDDYHIEYVEEHTLKDTVNKYPHSQLALMRHFPEVKRMVVIPEDPTSFSIFDYSLKEISHVKPDTLFGYNKMRSQKTSGVPKDRHEILEVYDVCYIPFRDLYCYCSSDHTIIMMKPHTDSTGKKFHYSLYNKIQHGYRHVKLCWSESCRVLCSVSAVNDIFGWTVDGKTPVFQVSRHKEMITDFLALEDVGLFATCSLDKRIVLWSQSTQRVRGVLIGHERGIKVMSYAKNTLVTAGFEMDIKVWNVSLQENSLILRGHRAPISAVKIMCQPKAHDLEMRTLSVDDRGEFRLWDIRVKAGTDVKVVNSMHTFNMNDAHLSQVRFLAVPYETKFSRESYSNFICASSKLVRFKPEKVCKDFLPCSEMMYSRGNNALLLSVGRSLFKYDIISGVFQNCISNVDKTEIASMCADDRHRIYVGCTNGDVLLLKFSTGQILSSIRAHQHSVTALSLVQMGNGSNMIFSGSMGGTLRTIDDTCGNLAINNTAGKAFKDNLSIALIRNLKDAKVFIAASNDTKWGVWTDVTLKNLLTFKEESKVIDLVEIAPQNTSDTFGRGMGTVVVCTEQYLKIYALDFKHLDFHITHVLGNTNTFVKRSYLSAIILKCPPNSVNYAESEDVEYSDTTLLAGCDDGYLVGWDAKEFRDESIKSYFTVKPAYSEAYMKQKKQLDHEAAMKRQSKRLKKEAAMVVALTPTKLLDDNLADDEDSDYSDCSSESDDIFAGDGEVDDDSSLFSLTSKVGLLNVNTAGGVNVQRMAHTVRCDAEGNPKHDVLLPPAVESFDTHIPTSPPKGRRAMLLKHDTFSFNYTKSASFQYSTTRPCVCWKGHEGAISTLIGLDEHGCLVTSGVDGFQRIWNLQMKCLGIMLLPNITEEMKEYYRQNVVKYSFIMESIKITKMHEKLALRLSDIIIKECDDTEVKAKSLFRRHGTMGKNMGVAAKEHAVQKVIENATEQDILRGGLLKVVTTDYIREESHDDVSDDTTKDQSDVKFVKDDYQSPTVDTRPNTSPASFSSVGTVTLTHFPPAAGATLGEGKNDINSVISMRPGTCPSLQPVQDGSSTCSMTSLTTKSSFSCSSAANLARVRRAAAAQHAKGIYGTKELWVNSESMMDKQSGLTAFSEKSVMKSMGDGLIDHEGHMCLRQVKKDAVKVKAYDRAVEKLMLKNCRQSTSVRIAAATAVKPPEIMFGAQKNMYGNANSLINSKRAKTSASDRHHMAMTMIKNSTRRHEGEMVHSVDPLQAFSDNIVIPGLDSQDVDTEAGTTSQANPAAPKEVTALPRSRTAGRRSGIVDMTISTEPPVTKGRDSKVLDRVRMASWIQKVTEAEEGAIPEWEARENKRREEADRKNKRKARKDNVAHNHHVMKMLENKLTKSVIAFHAALGDEDPNKAMEARPVTTRDLLPYYRAADFKSFFNVYLCVDEEFKGEIDVNQWVFFFSKMKKTVSKKTAYLLFTDLDKDADGKLTVEDLIDFMFSKANQKQMELMKSHIMKVIRKNQAVGHLGVTEAELNQIFDYYDEDFVGYIKVRSLKDRLKSFNLPSPASASIYTKMRDLYDDDMISLIEFVRLFKPYLIVDHIQ